MGMYSGLGSLDSSSYADYQNKNEQQLKEGQLQTQLEQSKQTKSVDDQFNNYKQQALSALQSYGTQYQQAKNGISQAMAQGNINEASALAQAAQEAQNQYNSIQDNMRNWASQSAILKAQGIDVSGALAGINGDQYAQNAQNQLTQASNYGASLMPKMNQMLAFIGDDKKNRNPYQQYA
jgi:phosphopantetheinyl transferase